ncbi:hypothetical protein [Nostoc sp.]|uniref:hypothetical protein n=1 Tax=Nostoc sp. TaxID=1180 RepID=UPI002FF91590
MEAQAKEIKNYLTYNGINPLFEWFDSLRDMKSPLADRLKEFVIIMRSCVWKNKPRC